MSVMIRLPLITLRNLTMLQSCNLSSTKVRQTSDEALEKLSEDELLAINQKKAKVVETKVNAMRLDLMIKAGLGISRNKVETAFYDSLIRLNGKKAVKKSAEIAIDDEIIFINADKAPENQKLLNVSRLKVLDAELDNNMYRVDLLREKNLLIEDDLRSWES